MNIAVISFLLALAACGKAKTVDEQQPAANDRVGELRAARDAKLQEADAARDGNGWIDHGCDAFLWQSLAAAGGLPNPNLTAAEDPHEPGRFYRRPAPCWTPKFGDVGSRSGWSKDMGMGLDAAAWRTGDRGLVERHVSYGRAHQTVSGPLPVWKMGEPSGELAVYYSPAQVGLTYLTLHALGGRAFEERKIPNVYDAGLDDYRAHLQVLDIWLRGEIAEATGELDNAPPLPKAPKLPAVVRPLLEISQTMLDRVNEHAAREPRSRFYAYMAGLYSGDMSRAVDLCLDDTVTGPDYLRCDGRCDLAEWLFACGSVLRRFD